MTEQEIRDALKWLSRNKRRTHYALTAAKNKPNVTANEINSLKNNAEIIDNLIALVIVILTKLEAKNGE